MRIRILSITIIALGLIAGSLLLRSVPRTRASGGFGTGTGSTYSYGTSAMKFLTLNSDGSVLYISYTVDGYISCIDTSTMQETGTIVLSQGCHPWRTVLSPDESYLYAVCMQAGPGKVARVDLTTMQQTFLSLTGDPVDIAVDPNGSRMWVVHRTYPWLGDSIPDPNLNNAPPETGYLAEIGLSNFTISDEIPILSVPYSVWFSPTEERLFVSHDLSQKETEDHFVRDGGVYKIVTAEWERVTIYDVSQLGDITPLSQELHGASPATFSLVPDLLESWSDDGSCLAISNPAVGCPPFSMRVADAGDFTSFDLTFPDANNEAMGVYYAQKVPGHDVLWTKIGEGRAQVGYDPQPSNILVRVETESPYDFQAYLVNEVTTKLGHFAVSPDGDTLYISITSGGDIIKWIPDDNAPVCSLSSNMTTYVGPAPGVFHFDASGSYDPDQGDTISFSWDFNGDSVFGDSYDSGTESQPIKNYYADYTGPVTVRVTDNHGAHSDCSVPIIVDIT